jgi:SAM-dependent methyltransferase
MNENNPIKNLPFYFQWESTINKIKEGSITIDDLRQSWQDFLAQKETILAQLSTLKNAELQRYTTSKDKKERLVKIVWGRLGSAFLAASPNSGWYAFQESPDQSVTRNLSETSQDDLDAYVKALADKKVEDEKIATNPETYHELSEAVRRYGEHSLNFDQWLAWSSHVAASKMSYADAKRERAAVVQKIDLEGDIDFVVKESFHTKRQCKIWIVKMSERLDRDKWKDIDAKARRFGARWSSWGPMENHGWIFFEEEDLAKFLDLKDGDGSVVDRWNRRDVQKQEKAVDRLQSVAQTLELAAMEELQKERKTNTVKRANEAENALYAAEQDVRWVRILRSISNAIEKERVSFLQNLRFATQARLLENLLQGAKYRAVQNLSDPQQRMNERDRSPVLEDIRYVKYPWPRCSKYTMSRVARNLHGKRGAKSISQALQVTQERASDEWIQAEGETEAKYWESALQYVSDDEFKSCLREWKLLEKMGIDSIEVLRAALAEYMLYRPEVESISAIDKVRLAELDLVGRKIPGFFPTPTWLAEKMVEMAEIKYGDNGVNILEPSAGSCRIADAIRKAVDPLVLILDVCEINFRLRDIIKLKGYSLAGEDFLDYDLPTPPYDYILMNPPFENNQDIVHVMWAYNRHLKPGGRLVAIMSEHGFFAQDTASKEFRDWTYEVAAYNEKLPEGTFEESGTGVNSRLIVIDKQ